VLARQALYLSSHAPALFALAIFEQGLTHILDNLNHDPIYGFHIAVMTGMH
jgi:hypothetical protein